MKKPRLLWTGDAVVHSGFSRVTHNVLEHLRHSWDVACLGICYQGDPHLYPYPIYTVFVDGAAADPHGSTKLPQVIKEFNPDLVLVLHDPWIVADRFVPLFDHPKKLAAYLPVDAPNMKREIAETLSALGVAIFYTEFGKREATTAGFSGNATVIPHGVDLSLYTPVQKAKARHALGLDESWWIVGYAGRNQIRKRLDLLIESFACWREKYQPENARLYLHCDPKDCAGWDLFQLAQYFKCDDALIYQDGLTARKGIPESNMKYVYSAMNVHMNTSLGEGWGLPVFESMACGIPNIVPSWAGLGDWARDAVRFVPVTGTLATPLLVNTLGALVDKADVIEALQDLYLSEDARSSLSKRGLARVHEKRFRWENIATQFDQALRPLL